MQINHSIETLEHWGINRKTDLILMMDHQEKILFMNPILIEMLQLSDLEMIHSCHIFEFIHENDQVYFNERLSEWTSNHFTPFFVRFKRMDGSAYAIYWTEISETADWIQLKGFPTILHNEKVYKIDWRKSFFNRPEYRIALLNKSGKVIVMNLSLENMSGWSLFERIGKDLPMIPILDGDNWDILISNAVNEEKTTQQNMILLKKDGTHTPVKVVVSPVYSESGEVKTLSVVVIDLSEIMEYKMIVEMQSKLMESEERLLLDITENISEVIFFYDVRNQKILYVSPSMEKWGICVEHIYNSPEKIFKQVFVKNMNELQMFFFSDNPAPRAIEFELIYRENNTAKWVRLEITPIADENGDITRHISIFKDITELKEQSYQIKQLDQLGAIGQLAAGIAHEIRNPLTSVKGFVQLLAEETNGKYNHIIMSEIDRIELILSDFLTLAQPQKEINFKRERINDVLKDAVSFMAPEALLHNVQINMVEATLPNVNCEAKQIKQVMMNLIKNAIEAMPTGGTIDINTSINSSGFISIKIKDEGVGISQDRIERLREPFFSNKEKGTGLGVMISFKIIEDHHGSIQFSSEEGKGTLVEILLPPAKNKNAYGS